MGRYFAPSRELPNVGRLLITSPNYNALVSQLRPDEMLVGDYDYTLFHATPILDAREFADFERKFNEGVYITHTFYAVSASHEEIVP